MKEKLTLDEFTSGWLHFCACIDFGKSNLDAEAIQFMNEVPGKIQQMLINTENNTTGKRGNCRN